jgi:hypothetical protein
MRRFRTSRLLVLALTAWATLGATAARAQTAVVTIKSVDDVTANVQYVLGLVGRQETVKQIQDLITAAAGNDALKGIDTKRPLGAYLVGIPTSAQPPAVGFVPVADKDALLGLLENLTANKIEKKGDLYTASYGGQNVFLKFSHDYVFVSDSDANLAKVSDPKTFLPKVNQDHLFAATARLDQLPKELKGKFLEELDKGIAKDAKRHEGEKDAQFEFRTGITKAARDLVAMAVSDAEEASLSFQIDQKASNVAVELSVRPRSGTDLAKRARAFAPADGLAPIHFEIAVGKLALLLLPEDSKNTDIAQVRKIFTEAAKDNQGRVKLSMAGGETLYLRFDLSTHLIKLIEVGTRLALERD